jgi:hypothetical protein
MLSNFKAGMEGFPSRHTPFEKTGDALKLEYSLASVAPEYYENNSEFQQQLEELQKEMQTPSANQAVRRHKQGEQMAPKSKRTQDLRGRAVGEFLGFLFLHNELAPNFKHIMDPVLVSMYWGFMVAKNLRPSTMKLRLQVFRDCIPYVTQHLCPHTPTWDQNYIKNVKAWYTNALGILTNQMKRQVKTISEASLHEVWENAWSKYCEFTHMFGVSQSLSCTLGQNLHFQL